MGCLDLSTGTLGRSILFREVDKVSLDSAYNLHWIVKLTSNAVDMAVVHSLEFERNAAEELMMLNAPTKAQHYGPAMRDVRGHHRLRSRLNLYARDQMRRFADVLIACTLLAVTAPLLLLIAAALKLESPGPVLKRRSCIGHGGCRFQMLNFRTMADDPEGSVPLWLRQPTPLGQFLRLTRVEALPQLINVLRGEMSMIDPQRRSPSFLD